MFVCVGTNAEKKEKLEDKQTQTDRQEEDKQEGGIKRKSQGKRPAEANEGLQEFPRSRGRREGQARSRTPVLKMPHG